MTCNHSEKLNRIVAAIATLAIFVAVDNAFAIESDVADSAHKEALWQERDRRSELKPGR